MPADRAAGRFLAGFLADFRAKLRTLDQHPGRRIGHQRRQHRMVELMAAADRTIGAEQRRTGKREIADGVERLVTGKFVGEAETVRIEQPVLVDDKRILERSAERVASAPKLRSDCRP